MSVTEQDQGGSTGSSTTRLKGIRRTAARRMVAAWEAPVFHLEVEVDMTRALGVRERVEGATVTDALLQSCARALVEHPALNAHYGDEAVTTFERANIGLAVATEAGLMVPVLHEVDRLDLGGISARRRDIATRARAGGLQMSDVTGGTFTVSNLGMMGIDRFDAILNVPQVAILAVGSTRQRQVWTDDGPVWRPTAQLTLTCDHRAIDGATGAAFLGSLRTQLESV